MRIASVAVAMAAICAAAAGQEIKFPANLDRLSAIAEESVDVTLDGAMLRLTARFLSDKRTDEARAKRVITGLDGIYVRSYRFAHEGEYDSKDLDDVRAQLKGPDWSRIVGVRCVTTGEDVDVYFKATATGQFGGIVVIAADRRDLTIVNLAGTITPEDLADLGGQFHIPRLDVASTSGRRKVAR